MNDNYYQKVMISFLNAKSILELFEKNCIPIENALKKIALDIGKIRPDNATGGTLTFSGSGVNLLIQYACLINPYFSSIKTSINFLQHSIESKYRFKVSGKGFTMKFFGRLKKEKPHSKECEVFESYKTFVKEIKDTRDSTEHYNPKTIVKFKEGEEFLTIPIYNRNDTNQFEESKRVHFLTYMNETNKKLTELINKIRAIPKED